MRIKWFSLVRVTGLLLVLLYHFFISPFKGGFIGVDLFFTFSGFLITALLIDEFTRDQSIALGQFYKRRFYRIVPPVILMLLVVLPLTLLVRNDFRAGIGSQVAAVLGFVTNISEILSGNSYENQFTPHLFVHTWSLAVEMHFYLLWGLAVWGMTKLARSAGQLRGMLFMTSGAIFTISYLSMFFASFFVGGNFSRIYYSSFTHIFPFFLGAALATLTGVTFTTGLVKRLAQQWPLQKTLLVIGVSFLGSLLLSLILDFNSIWTYLFGCLLASICAGAMILATRILHEKTPDKAEPKVLTFFSDISYGMYLFHWPFFILFKQFLPSPIAALVTFILSTICAAFSYYVVEPLIAGKEPAMFGKRLVLNIQKQWLGMGAAALAAISLLIIWTAPAIGKNEQQLLVDNLHQMANKMQTTRQAAENAQATDYNIKDGTVIIGDSVTVRANDSLQSTIQNVQIDGEISRHLEAANELIQSYAKSNVLPENVVVALGTNPSENYQVLLDEIVEDLPRGHRLIFVTPYDGSYSDQNLSVAYQTGLYMKQLAGRYDYVTVADWWKEANEHPEYWTGTDFVHFNEESDAGSDFASLIKTTLKRAADRPVKK